MTMSTCAGPTVEDIACEPPESLADRLQQAEEAVEAARLSAEPMALVRALVGLARLRFRLGQCQAA